MWGKLKLNFQPAQYKKKLTKKILKNNTWENTVVK
jgi:hypothetical protein